MKAVHRKIFTIRRNLQSNGRTWDKVLKSGLSTFCGRRPLKFFAWPTLEYFVPYITYGS